jgi:hypothetical protein
VRSTRRATRVADKTKKKTKKRQRMKSNNEMLLFQVSFLGASFESDY